MTSTISYLKHIKENIRHRSWLPVISFVSMFLCMPLYTQMSIDFAETMNYGPDYTMETWARETIPFILNGHRNIFMILLILGMGVLCAVTGFSHLHSREKQDFYFSFPVTKQQWFSISQLSGLIIFIAPYILFSISVILIASANGFMDQNFFQACIISMLQGILMFFLVYEVTILALILTGQMLTGILGSIVLFIYGTAVSELLLALFRIFLKTWNPENHPLFTVILEKTSPVWLFMNLLTSPPSELHAGFYVLLIAELLLIFWLALFLYRNYPAESAGKALSFRRTESWIKVCISIPAGLAAGLFTTVLFGQIKPGLWYYCISLLAVLLTCLLIEFIYHHDLKMLFHGKLSTIISVLSVLILILILPKDPFGYDTYLPEQKELKKISFYCYEFEPYFYSSRSDQMFDQLMISENQDEIYRLAEKGVENVKKGLVTPDNSIFITDTPYADETDLVSIAVCFETEHGKKICRRYSVRSEDVLHVLETIEDQKSFRTSFFPVFQISDRELSTIPSAICTPLSQETFSISSIEEMQKLLTAYRKDLLHADWEQLAYESPIAGLYFTCDDPSIDDLPFYACIYDSFVNVKAVLEKQGHPLVSRYNASEISQILLTDTFAPSRIITDREEISKMAEKITYTSFYSGMLRHLDTPPDAVSCEVHLKDTATVLYGYIKE